MQSPMFCSGNIDELEVQHAVGLERLDEAAMVLKPKALGPGEGGDTAQRWRAPKAPPKARRTRRSQRHARARPRRLRRRRSQQAGRRIAECDPPPRSDARHLLEEFSSAREGPRTTESRCRSLP